MNINNENFFTNFPVINGSKFIMREILISDSENFLQYMSHPEVKRFLSSDDLPTDIESSRSELFYWRSLFKNRRSIYWGIESDNRIIGTCGFNSWSQTHRKCEISYDLSYDYWGKGIMTEAVKLVIDFAFKKMNVNRIQSTVAINNLASIRVLEKNNFICEGRLEKYGILHGKVKDFFMYSRVKNGL